MNKIKGTFKKVLKISVFHPFSSQKKNLVKGVNS